MSGIVQTTSGGHTPQLGHQSPQQPYGMPPTYPNWVSPGCIPSNTNYPSHYLQSLNHPDPYSQQHWSNQSQTYTPQPMPLPPLPNQQNRAGCQSVLSPVVDYAGSSVTNNGNTMPQHASSDCQVVSRKLTSANDASVQQNQRHYRDDSAWVEEATAVTGATSETGLSGGADNFSRFSARYGLAASLGATSTGSIISGAAAALIMAESDDVKLHTCSSVFGSLLKLLLAIATILSPVLMLLLPQFPHSFGWSTGMCTPTCEGYLIGISVKLILLLVASWILTFPCRPLCGGGETVILPRIHLCRALFSCLVFVALFAFWLFYVVRVIQPKESDYLSIVLFAGSLTDTLLFLHFTGIAMLELRRFRSRYAIHIVRSPDGESKSMRCGSMSVQRAAMEVLQFYMVSFTAFNPSAAIGITASQPVPKTNGLVGGKRSRRQGQSRSNSLGGNVVDNQPDNNVVAGTNAASASSRLYDEIDLDKRKRKRRMRLLLAVEEAFNRVRRLAASSSNNNGLGNFTDKLQLASLSTSSSKCLDPYEAAQAVFPTLIRPLQKYLRVTKQQARHPVDSVIDHLALCLAYTLSPLAFLDHFNPSSTTPQLEASAAATALKTAQRQSRSQATSSKASMQSNDRLLDQRCQPGGQQAWSIVADRALSRHLADGAVFQLKRSHGSDVSLLCVVRRLPLIRLVEAVLGSQPMEAGRFVLSSAGGSGNAV